MPLLEVKGLHAGYGRVPILHDIDLAVDEGEFVGILGHNGMGKTTLLRAIMGFVPATAGSIEFNGAAVERWPTHRRAHAGLALVPQGREIFPNLTVMENLTVGSLGKGVAATKRDDVLDLFPRLHEMLDRRGGALSGGEQQILALARCLCNDPRLILLDEPTEGIQPSIIQDIAEVLQTLRQQHQLTIVLVEQNLDFITALADRVLIIQKGEITGEVAADELGNAAAIEEFTGFAA